MSAGTCDANPADPAEAVAERDYVLGTHDDEIDRLALQHRVWRPVVLDCWQRAGVREGLRALDVGAGPGFATFDLAELVGPGGSVTAIERSARFAAHLRQLAKSRGLAQIEVLEQDLLSSQSLDRAFDVAWCRWVAAFVTEPRRLIELLGRVVRLDGVALFHEYVHYETWQFLPPRPAHTAFVQAVMKSWRANGGEPDIGRALPQWLGQAGFEVQDTRVHGFTVGPHDPRWAWPERFIDVNVSRLVELGFLNAATGDSVRREFAEAGEDPECIQMTPLVLEIRAVKRSR